MCVPLVECPYLPHLHCLQGSKFCPQCSHAATNCPDDNNNKTGFGSGSGSELGPRQGPLSGSFKVIRTIPGKYSSVPQASPDHKGSNKLPLSPENMRYALPLAACLSPKALRCPWWHASALSQVTRCGADPHAQNGTDSTAKIHLLVMHISKQRHISHAY